MFPDYSIQAVAPWESSPEIHLLKTEIIGKCLLGEVVTTSLIYSTPKNCSI